MPRDSMSSRWMSVASQLLIAGREVAELESGHRHAARAVREPLAVGTHRRTEAGAEVLRATIHAPRLAIVHDDLRRAHHLVVAGRAGARAGVDVATVRRDATRP